MNDVSPRSENPKSGNPKLENPKLENPNHTNKDSTKTDSTNKRINKKRTTTKETNVGISKEMEKVIQAWNDTFEVVVDVSDQQLLEAIAKAIEDFATTDLLQAIKYRSQAKFYKEDYPHLRDNPKSFFEYPQTIKNDMNRRPYKLITYRKKCELEQQGTDKRFEIDPNAEDSKSQPKWRMYE